MYEIKISLIIISGETEFLVQNLFKCEEDPYHSETNRGGYINLGTAVNALVEDLISDRLTKVNVSLSLSQYIVRHWFSLR